MRMSPVARLEDLGDLGGRPPVGGHLDRHPGEDALGHRGALRVDDVDLAVGQHVARDLGALDRARQRARDMDRHDRLGAGREGRLVGVLEVAGRRGRGRSGTARRARPSAPRTPRSSSSTPALNVSSPKVTSSGTIAIPPRAASAGSRSDAESVKIATRLKVGSSSADRRADVAGMIRAGSSPVHPVATPLSRYASADGSIAAVRAGSAPSRCASAPG